MLMLVQAMCRNSLFASSLSIIDTMHDQHDMDQMLTCTVDTVSDQLHRSINSIRLLLQHVKLKWPLCRSYTQHKLVFAMHIASDALLCVWSIHFWQLCKRVNSQAVK